MTPSNYLRDSYKGVSGKLSGVYTNFGYFAYLFILFLQKNIVIMFLVNRVKVFFSNDRVKKIRNVILIGLIAYVIAFFVDQYYILGKKWWFILELIWVYDISPWSIFFWWKGSFHFFLWNFYSCGDVFSFFSWAFSPGFTSCPFLIFTYNPHHDK